MRKYNMRLAFFSDIHGNLPALEAIINDIKNEDIDYTVFMGDAIGLGPKPFECLKLLLDSNIYFNYGNHEQYALEGIENFKLERMEKEILPHYLWVREQVKDIIEELMSMKICFLNSIKRNFICVIMQTKMVYF